MKPTIEMLEDMAIMIRTPNHVYLRLPRELWIPAERKSLAKLVENITELHPNWSAAQILERVKSTLAFTGEPEPEAAPNPEVCGLDAIGDPAPLHNPELCAGTRYWDTLIVPIDGKSFTSSVSSMPDCMIEHHRMSFPGYPAREGRQYDYSGWVRLIEERKKAGV